MANMSIPKPCQFYVRGNCAYGDTCRNSHTSLVIPLLSSKGPTPKSSPMAIFRNIKPCKFYNEGRCSKGSYCTFAHVVSTKKPLPTPVVPNPILGNASVSPTPCIFFKSQRCRDGVNCSFSHDVGDPVGQAPSEGSVRTEAIGSPKSRGKAVAIRRPDALANPTSHGQPAVAHTPDGNLIEREIDGSKVVFAPGPTVQSVETVFESRIVVLTGIPDVSSSEDILQLLKPPLEYKMFTFDPKVAPLMARFEFSNAKQAVAALESFHEAKLHGANICARIDCARTTTDTGSLRSTKVKVSWFKPTRIAWSHYKSYKDAQHQAKRLQGKSFDQHKLSVTLQPRTPNQRSSFSIEIKGLPLDFYANDLVQFCRASRVTVGSQSFDGPTSYKAVKQLLETHGTVESVEAAADSSKSRKMTVFAHFGEWHEAENACKALNSQPQSLLRYSKLMLENVHAIRYNIRRDQYQSLKWELLKLQRRQPPGCKLRIYDETDSDVVCVRGYSSSAKTLASLKISIEVLIRGETLKLADGSIPWEDRYASKDTQDPLLTLASKHQCWIKFDTVHRRMFLHGSAENCKALGSILLQKFEAQRKQRHVIPLDAPEMRGLLKGGLSRVEQLLGEGKTRLDICLRTLTIEGPDSALVETKRLLHTLGQPSEFHSGPSCPVCLGDPVNPTVLECGHVYCTECITRHLKAQSTDRSPNCCCLFVQDDKPCGRPVATDVLRRLLTPEEEGRVFKAVYQDYIHTRPKEFLYCPAADCPTIYRRAAGVLRCPSCLTKICSSCDVEYHDGITCGEYQEEVKKELAVMEEWKKGLGVRSCPNCRTNLNKEEGCNHVLCVHCHRHICWVCMETFEDDKPCYIHMGAEHAGIGLPQRDV